MNTKEIISKVLDDIPKPEENKEKADYINAEDGLLYCIICNTPKEQIIELAGEKKKIYKPCTCRQKEIDEERKEQEEFDRRMKLNMLRQAAFGDNLLYNQTFEDEDGTLEHKDFAMNYVKNFSKMESENIGLLLTGAVGTGKTYLAAAIANTLIEDGVTVRMTNFATILNDMTNLQIEKNKYIKNLNSCRLLIIDDLGIQRDTTFALEHIFNIIDSRYRTKKPVIFTTNLSLDALVNTNDLREKRIYSRVLEMAIPLVFSGEDRRLKKMKEKAKYVKTILGESRW